MALNELDRPTVIAALKEMYEIEQRIRADLDLLHQKMLDILNDVRD